MSIKIMQKYLFRIPGPFSLVDDSVLRSSLSKIGFRNIEFETQNIILEFASVKDYINHVRDVATPIKAMLDKESTNRQEEIWKLVTEEVTKSNYTNANGSLKLDNECVCVIGTR